MKESIAKRTNKQRRITAILSSLLIFSAQAAGAEVIEFDDVVVTGTREETSKSEISETVGQVSGVEIRDTKPTHPSEIMRQVPGVHVNVTGGEGHMTSIRQPITTGAVYLYLEDGIPTRSTGFFNHNALYEVNVPQSDGIEVTKGPGTSLYGSDAIGGVINVITRPSPLSPEFEATREWGEFGWKRTLISGGNTSGKDGFRADINSTHTDGWRDGTEYDRTSTTLRWDRYLDNGATLKTLLSESDIDQETAGSSRLLSDDFYNNPKYNYTPISYRKVEAFRLSMAYEKEEEDSLLSITPYFRDNSMDMLPNWSLSYDPVVYETENQSFGLMAKYRKDFAPYRTRVIVGADIDHSPGSRLEEEITPTKVGNVYTDYVKSGTTLYDYDVEYTGISPYMHVETSPIDNLRINAGLRYDDINYDYENHLSTLTTGNHRRPASQEVNFSRVSPKLGATYQFSENLNAFASYREAFRAPGEGQLFKQGKSVTPAGLQPVKVDSYEIGIRGKAMDKVRYEVSLYRMEKKDDILTYTYPDNTRESMNAGETQHEGVEIGLGVDITDDLALDVAYSYAEHTYEDWKPKAGVDYSGNDMASAPRVVANTKLNYSPQLLNGGKVGLEWTHLGKYWMDDANTHEYNGYDVINLRANYRIGKSWDIFGRVLNLNDKRYATAAKYTPAGWNPEKFEYSPGMPRTFYAGLTYKWSGE